MWVVCSTIVLPPYRDTVFVVWRSAHVKLLHACPVLQASSQRLNLKTRILPVYILKSFLFFPLSCLLMFPLSSSSVLSVIIFAHVDSVLWSGIICDCKVHKILFPGCGRISGIFNRMSQKAVYRIVTPWSPVSAPWLHPAASMFLDSQQTRRKVCERKMTSEWLHCRGCALPICNSLSIRKKCLTISFSHNQK